MQLTIDFGRQGWRFRDLTGQRFGNLVVLAVTTKKTSSGNAVWLCRCDCGKQSEVASTKLVTGHTKSCGCGRVGPRPPKGKEDITGLVVGKLTVLRLSAKRKGLGERLWECRCECGKLHKVTYHHLSAKKVRSCGCRKRELIVSRNFRHGQSTRSRRSPEHVSYCAARSRCTYPKYKDYRNYGGRGIQFKFKSFEEFYACIGPRPSLRHSLDRYPDQNGHYEPGNVRWATPKEQCNNKSNNRCLTVDGERLTVAQAARSVGCKPGRILSRLNSGWCDECTVKLPQQKHGRNKGCPHRS